MSSSITDGLMGHLQGTSLSQLGSQLGITPQQAQGAVAAALPLLIGALGRNASAPQGAQALLGALERDHYGRDPATALGSALGGGPDLEGQKIVSHIFGPRQDLAAQGLGAATGLTADRSKVLLRWLAPVAMAYLAKRLHDKRAGGATAPAAPTPTDLTKTLGEEQSRIQKQGGPGGKLLEAVLDRNHDGKVDFSDLLAMGSSRSG